MRPILTILRLMFRAASFYCAASWLAACVSLPQSAAAELIADADVLVINNFGAGGVQQQFRAQFEPILKVELSFVNRVCKLTDDERRTVIGKTNKWLDEFIADYAKQGGQPQLQGAWFGGGRPQTPDARDSIEKGVATVVQAALPKEKSDLYVEESKKRAAFAQKTSVDNIVTRIDKELILSPEQRDKLVKSLTDHWDKNWAPQIETFMHGMDVLPNVPDQWVRPHLSAAQQIAWGRVNKQSGHIFFGGNGMEGQVIDDIDLKEGQPEEKANDKPAAAAGLGARADGVVIRPE